MMQLPFWGPQIWSITEITRYLRDLLESDEVLQDLWVQGEVSNFSRPSSGHIYFTLKDQSSSLRCVMWRNSVARQAFLPRDGQAVEVHGNINVYEVAGQYQLYADLIRPAGEGALYQEFVRLKNRLEAEGLFDPERKRAIPRWPHTIGIVTSPTGAALRDVLNTLRRRFPIVKIVLAPSPVQGEDAPPAIVAGLSQLNARVKPDVILLVRGGGSIEDLWAFNDERVARAIADSIAPVICGVGHETDFTIADFVSDLRAPTPTAAAELATPNRSDVVITINELTRRLGLAIQSVLANNNVKLDRYKNQLRMHSPQAKIRTDQQRLDDYTRQISKVLFHGLQLNHTRLAGLEQRLVSLNPMSVLSRGYAIVTSEDGNLVRSINQVRVGEDLNVRLADGQFGVNVKNPGKEN